MRLKENDYNRSGGYFITIVTHRRQLLFGAVVNGEMRLSPTGMIAGGFVDIRRGEACPYPP